MNRNNRLALLVLAVALSALLVVCLVGAAFVFYVYSSTGEPGMIASTPTARSTVAPPTVAPARPRAGQGQTLVLRPLGAPLTLDPHLVQDADSAEFVVHIFGGLVAIDENLKLVPDLAERWEISPDGRMYTFTLRRGVTFHDGKPLTAHDVKYSFERALDPNTHSPVANTYLGDIVGARDRLTGKAGEVAGVKVLDDSTVQITIDAPKSYFLWQLTYTVAAVVDRANIEKGGATWADRPNGSGPFRLVSKSSSEIVLARNESYYGSRPKLGQVRFLLTGPTMQRYETGDIDMVQVTGADIARVTDPRNPLNRDLQVADQFSLTYLGFDTSVPPFDDMKVRQALARAIDKDKLASVVLKGMASKADGILPAGLPGYNSNLRTLTYDPALAKQLLAESKYAAAMPSIVLSVMGSGAAPVGLPAAIQEMIRQNLGITIEIQLVQSDTFFAGLYAHKYPMFITGWIADYPDPYDFLDVLFHSQSELNHGGYASQELDRLLEAARVERDETRRLALYRQAEQMLVSDAPVIPLVTGRDYWLVKPYVKGVKRPPLVIPWLSGVSIEE